MIAAASNYAHMLIGTALIGVGGGATFVGIMVSMTETLPHQIGLAMGLFELAAYGGSSIGTYFGGNLALERGLRYPFFIFILISTLGAVSSFFILPETKIKTKDGKTPRISLSNYRPYFIKIMPLSLAGFSSKIMDSLMISFLPLYLLERQIGLEGVAVILSAFTLSWALLQPLTGHLSDKFGRKMMTVIGLSGSSMTVIALTLTSNYLYLVFLALFLGFEAALFYTPLVAMVSDIAPPEVEGTLIGSYRFFRDMGYFIGPVILGKIADMYKLDYSIYLTSVILLVAVIVLIFKLKETNQQNI